MAAIASFAAAFRTLWPSFAGRDARMDRWAGLCPDLCKEAGLRPEGGAWMR